MHRIYFMINRKLFITIIFYILSSCVFLNINNSLDNYFNNFALFFIKIDFSGLFLFLYLPFLLYFYFIIDNKNKQFTLLYTIRFTSIENYIVNKFKTIITISITLVLGLIISSLMIWLKYKENVQGGLSFNILKNCIFKMILLILFTMLLLLFVELIHIKIKELYLSITVFVFSFYFIFLLYSLGLFSKIIKKVFVSNKLSEYNYLLFEIFNSQFLHNGFMDDLIIISIYFSLALYLFFKLYLKYYYRVMEDINENY